MTAARGFALATSQRMVNGVHGYAAALGTLSLPAVAARLPDLHQLRL
jgi:hypothetical protein